MLPSPPARNQGKCVLEQDSVVFVRNPAAFRAPRRHRGAAVRRRRRRRARFTPPEVTTISCSRLIARVPGFTTRKPIVGAPLPTCRSISARIKWPDGACVGAKKNPAMAKRGEPQAEFGIGVASLNGLLQLIAQFHAAPPRTDQIVQCKGRWTGHSNAARVSLSPGRRESFLIKQRN